MVLVEILSSIIKRLLITDEELNQIRNKDAKPENKSKVSENILVNSLRKYINMYFDDFFQVRSFADEEYREIINSIAEEIKKRPETVDFQIENLKQFNTFSKAMQKAIFKVVKEEEPNK